MPSINSLKASDGSGNASIATVQSVRSGGATTIDVDTVSGFPASFFATMGTPHTFTDPVTSETITVISEATAVDFEGSVDGSSLEIDEIAPGYTDGGSEVGDIVIVRPTTQWGDEVAGILGVSLNDDGTLKDDTVGTDQVVDASVTTAKLATGAGELGGAWQDWTPSYSAGGSMTYTSVTTTYAKYIQIGKTVFFRLRSSGTTGGTASNELKFTLPVNRADTDVTNMGATYVVDGGVTGGVGYSDNANQCVIRRYDSANFALSTARQIVINGCYEVA